MAEMEFLSFRPNLPVRDVTRALAFYRDVIGLDVVHAEPDGSFALLRREGAEVALVRADSPSPQGAYLYVRGVEALHARCQSNGVRVVNPLTRQPWGLLDFVIEDPDGHRIAVGESAAAPGPVA